MKIRKIKKRYKTMFRTQYCCTKVKFKKISTSIETEPREYPQMCGVFAKYEVRRWYHKKELPTRHASIKIARQKSKHYMKIQNIMQKYKTK